MTQEEQELDKVQIGRILHVVFDEGCVPAIVLSDSDQGVVDVKAVLKGTDRFLNEIPANHIQKVVGTWHWPRECHVVQKPGVVNAPR